MAISYLLSFHVDYSLVNTQQSPSTILDNKLYSTNPYPSNKRKHASDTQGMQRLSAFEEARRFADNASVACRFLDTALTGETCKADSRYRQCSYIVETGEEERQSCPATKQEAT